MDVKAQGHRPIRPNSELQPTRPRIWAFSLSGWAGIQNSELRIQNREFGIEIPTYSVAVFGASFGGIMATMTPMVGESFGLANIGKLLGLLDFSFALAALAGPLLAGFVYDAQGSYNMAFAITAGAALLAGILVTQTRCEVGNNSSE